MNNKIKAAEVACLIDGNEAYGQVFNALKDKLEGDEMIFAERVSGYGFLQWELPGDGWSTLADGDPIAVLDVKNELERRKVLVRSKFGDNQVMADKVLSYPDDSYVYYKTNPSGRLLILVTAWGYRHPVRIEGSGALGVLPVDAKKEPVSIQLTYDGKPTGEKAIKLNGMTRTTDGSGLYVIGDLPVGYQFDVEVEGKNHHVRVAEGMGTLTFDLTVFAEVDVEVALDGQPLANTTVNVSYGGKNMQLVTNNQGATTVKLPLSLDEQSCVVSVAPEPLAPQTQQKVLSGLPTHFVFAFETPVAEESNKEPVVDDAIPPVAEPPKEEKPEEKTEEKIDESAEEKGGIGRLMLFILLLAGLVGATYYFGLRLL